jgi:hypothetical protein
LHRYAVVGYLIKLHQRVTNEWMAAQKRLADKADTRFSIMSCRRLTVMSQPDIPTPEGEGQGATTTKAQGGVAQPASPASVSVRVEADGPTMDHQKLGPVGRLLLARGRAGQEPRMLLEAHHVDILMRYTYFPSFLICLLVYIVDLPGLPAQSAFLANACAS